ncbi:MAG: sugar porter family MFS transporter [Bacteroidota bacterium]
MLVKDKLNFKYILSVSLVSALGGLLFGYDWVVIGGAKPFYERYFEITQQASLQGWLVSCALVGCTLGAIGSGRLTTALGRKKPLIISAFLFTISAIGTGMVNTLPWFIVYRIMGGIGIGLASTISPIYIAELAPSQYRGRLVSLNQLTIVIGILAAQIINFLIAEPVVESSTDAQIAASWNGQQGWRWMFWAEAFPALTFFILTFFIPESPRWLGQRGHWPEVRQLLSRVGGAEYAKAGQEEIQHSLLQPKRNPGSALLEKKNRLILLIGIVLAVFQQWCGINVVFNYADEVFSAAGYSISDALFNIVITGIVNLVFTLVAIRTIDQWGRRRLLLFGSLGLAITYSLLSICYLADVKGVFALSLVLIGIAVYAMSLAPVTWVVLSEIFPNRIRGVAMAVATTALWVASFVLTYTFPLLNSSLGTSGTFFLYSSICLAGFLFIFRTLPETKNKSLEEIEKELVIENPHD